MSNIIANGEDVIGEISFDNVIKAYIFFDPTKMFQQLFAVTMSDEPVKKLFKDYRSYPDKFTTNLELTRDFQKEETDILDGNDALLIQLTNLKQFVYVDGGYFPIIGTETEMIHEGEKSACRVSVSFGHVEETNANLLKQLEELRNRQ